jgi:hypothetical protein
LLRLLAPLKVRVAKLFAKHMEVEEQAAALRDGWCPIAVGTPGRVRHAADAPALPRHPATAVEATARSHSPSPESTQPQLVVSSSGNLALEAGEALQGPVPALSLAGTHLVVPDVHP